MAKFEKVAANSKAFASRVGFSNVFRHGVEAFLLAAVAMGCAQAGWSILVPGSADARDGVSDSAEPKPQAAPVLVASPFTPNAAVDDGESQATNALLSGVQLAGVRVAEQPARSGAVLTMNDGAQRAFTIGGEIASGVRLTDVGADYIVISYAGGQRRIGLAGTAPGYSFARALMGREQIGGEIAPAPAAWSEGAAPAAAPAPAPAAAEATGPAAAAWLQATLAHVATENGQARGWRAAAPLPDLAAKAGLQAGDLILTVNGAGPAEPAKLLSVAQAPRIDLVVERDGKEIALTVEAGKAT